MTDDLIDTSEKSRKYFQCFQRFNQRTCSMIWEIRNNSMVMDSIHVPHNTIQE